MTNEIERLHIADIIEDSVVGEDNALTNDESLSLAEVVLNQYLVVRKNRLPEAKHMDTMIYAGNQAVHANSNPEDILEKALSFLAAAAKLTEIKEAAKAAQEKEMNELRLIINSFLGSSQWVKTSEDLSAGEIAAAREIKRLREGVAKFPLAG